MQYDGWGTMVRMRVAFALEEVMCLMVIGFLNIYLLSYILRRERLLML